MPSATAIGKDVATVPSSANSARIMLWKGRAMTKPTSSSTPMPMNTRQAIRAVAEHQRVDRLQPVDLQDVDQIVDVGALTSGSTNSVPILPASKNITPALTEAMPRPIGIISSGSSTFLAQVDQQETEQHQKDAPDHDLRLGCASSVAMP
jgi:hypothetical protein